MSLSRKKQNRQKLVAKLETEENSVRAKLEKYIEEKIRTQNYLEQKIAEKRLVLERKREKEATNDVKRKTKAKEKKETF